MNEPIWEGVYSNFQEVPICGSGCSGNKWIENSLKKIAAIHEDARKKKTIPSVTKFRDRDGLLSVVAAIVCHERGGVKILDFGGGIGFAYYQVAQSLPSRKNFEYHIVEMEAVAKAGRDFFKDEPNIFFSDSLPEGDELTFDLVYLGSSLQYIERWETMLIQLCGYKPRYVLFTDLLAGDIPTFATAQIYYGSKIPAWFFNVGEITDSMERLGYGLIFKSVYEATIRGKEGPLPQDNFEKKYQLDYPCNLLFCREGEK